jgi:intracellular septation protein
MQALLDFLPVIAFVATYWITGDMSTAIAVIMVAVALQVLATWILKRKLSRMLIASAVLVLVLGGISLILDDPLFFKWKPTGLYWLFALLFLGSQFIGAQPMVKRMMLSVAENEFELTDTVWKQLNLAWVIFFIIAGCANIYVAYNYSEATWVNFKLFGLFGMTFVFLVLQTLWLSRHITDTTKPGDEDSF